MSCKPGSGQFYKVYTQYRDTGSKIREKAAIDCNVNCSGEVSTSYEGKNKEKITNVLFCTKWIKKRYRAHLFDLHCGSEAVLYCMCYRQNNTSSCGRGAGNVGLRNGVHARAFRLQGLMLRLSRDAVKLLFVTMASLWRPDEKETNRKLRHKSRGYRCAFPKL